MAAGGGQKMAAVGDLECCVITVSSEKYHCDIHVELLNCGVVESRNC